MDSPCPSVTANLPPMKKTFKRQTGNSQRAKVNAKRETKKLPIPICLPAKNDETTHPKPSPVQPLQTAMATRRKSQTELSELTKLLAEKSARQIALETTGDLKDGAIITEISRLQVFNELLPRRIAAKEADDAKAEETLTQATNQFIHEHLGPRVRRLAARTRAIVEAELTSHYRDPSALIIAVSQSERVRTIESLALPATLHPPRGAIAHAEAVLKAWIATDEFEKTLPEAQNHLKELVNNERALP